MAASRRRANPASRQAHDLVERPVEQVGLVAQDDGLRRPVARVEQRPARRREKIDPPACLQPGPRRSAEALAPKLWREGAKQVRERLEPQRRFDADDGGGRILRRVDRCDRAADRVPDDDGRSRPAATTASWTASTTGLEALRGSARAAVGGQVEGDRPAARRAGRRARGPTSGGRTSSRAGRRSGGRARHRRRAIVRRGLPSGPGRQRRRDARAGGCEQRQRCHGSLLVASCGRQPRCRVARRPATGRGHRVSGGDAGLPGGWSPRCKRAGERLSRADRELAVGRAQMHLDRADGDVEGLRDLGVVGARRCERATRRSLGVSDSTPERAIRRGRAPAARSSTQGAVGKRARTVARRELACLVQGLPRRARSPRRRSAAPWSISAVASSSVASASRRQSTAARWSSRRRG